MRFTTHRATFATSALCCLGLAALLCFTGCPSSNNNNTGGGGGTTPVASGEVPSFSLAWSEYPSWSVFGVAQLKGLIDGAEGAQGPIEKKWGVDIVLNQLDYDTCITRYGAGQVDAVCITNMDILSPALGRDSVAVLPTSTSKGADACIVVGVEDVKQLRDKKVYGLDKSVSEYCFVRNLELLGEKEADHQFTAKGPAEAALAMQADPATTEAIMVWNPFVMQTLRKVEGSKVLFDSSTIPGEIVDMVVVGQDSLDREGGDKFAAAVIDTFYQVSDMIDADETHDDALLALAHKFAPELTVEDMEIIVTQTAFYKTPQAGTELLDSPEFKETMTKVLAFCKSHGIVDMEPKIAYGKAPEGEEPQLRFDTSYMQMVQEKGK